MDERRLSEEWADLQKADQVPERGKGKTAAEIERDGKRERKRYPTERRRAGRKISPTLSSELVQRLRDICKAMGYIGADGEGLIASSVIEDLLWVGVDAYGQGELEAVEEEVVEIRKRLALGKNHHPD